MAPDSPPNRASNATDDTGGLEPSLRLRMNEEFEQQDDPGSSQTGASAPSAHSLAGSYRRPSFFTIGPRATVVPHPERPEQRTEGEWEQGLEEERRLLTDNQVISGDFARRTSRSGRPPNNGLRGLLSSGLKRQDEEALIDEPVSEHDAEPRVDETSALLGNGSGPQNDGNGLDPNSDPLDQKFDEAVVAGLIQTTWKREAVVLVKYTSPLLVTFLLQYSLTVASIFTVGHIGKVELGAVSLASMTANITGYAIYQGLATSLDTLCAQAYGSGRKELVGLQMQRTIFFLWVVTIPIGILWLLADKILLLIVPETDVALLAGLYLKVVLLGAPGFACFEAAKRFVQAQGLFSAALFVLLICAPFNAFLNWLFVWHFEMGYVGAPIAVAITDNLLPLMLFLYVYFVAGMECWGGFTRRAFHNWMPMIRLALPGFLMVEAEVLAFEVLTLAASYFGATNLAAQSILSTLSGITFQLPFTLSIAGSTRIANLIGATLTDAARTSAKVNGFGAVIIGVVNITWLSALREYIPMLFTSDEDVRLVVAQILPVCASFQLFDALATTCNGILRGLGRQSVGGYVQLLCYYGVAIPISMGTAFGLGWDLWGLWIGIGIGLLLVSIIEGIFLARSDWERSVQEAMKRNTSG